MRKAIKSQVLSCQGLWFAVRFSAHRDGKFKLQAEESLGRARPVIRGHCSRNTAPPGMLLLFWLCSNTQCLAVQPKFNCTRGELQWAAGVPGCCHKTRGMRVQFRGQCSCVWSYWAPGQPSQALSPSPQISCGAFQALHGCLDVQVERGPHPPVLPTVSPRGALPPLTAITRKPEARSLLTLPHQPQLQLPQAATPTKLA